MHVKEFTFVSTQVLIVRRTIGARCEKMKSIPIQRIQSGLKCRNMTFSSEEAANAKRSFISVSNIDELSPASCRRPN